jgi:hypothetical protein
MVMLASMIEVRKASGRENLMSKPMTEVSMPWSPMRGGTKSGSGDLPGQRGRYLLLLGKPLLEGSKPRWVHFSWLNQSFCIRDFVAGRERRQEPGLAASDVWRQAIDKKAAVDDYYHSVEDVVWWADTLRKLDQET